MRRPPGSTYCFDIWRAAIDRSYNARQLLFIPNSSFLIPNSPRQIPICRSTEQLQLKNRESA